MSVIRSDKNGLAVTDNQGGTQVSVTQNNCGCCGSGSGQGTGSGSGQGTGSGSGFIDPGAAPPPLGDPSTPGTTPGSPAPPALPGETGDIHRVAPTCLALADPLSKPYGSEGFTLASVDMKSAITTTATAASLLKTGERLKSAKVSITGYCFMRLKAPGGIAISSDPAPLQYSDSSGTHLVYSKLYSGSAVADFLYYDQVVNILCDGAVSLSGELPSVNKLLFPNKSPADANDTAWIKCCLNEVIVGQNPTKIDFDFKTATVVDGKLWDKNGIAYILAYSYPAYPFLQDTIGAPTPNHLSVYDGAERSIIIHWKDDSSPVGVNAYTIAASVRHAGSSTAISLAMSLNKVSDATALSSAALPSIDETPSPHAPPLEADFISKDWSNIQNMSDATPFYISFVLGHSSGAGDAQLTTLTIDYK